MSGVTTKPIIVGIDGSEQAHHAALWAVDEALRRHTALRLIYVIRSDLTGTLSAAEYETDVVTAKAALAATQAAITQRNPSVAVQTYIAQGSPAGILLAESTDAELICVGSSGMGRMGREILGSTAASVAEQAACAVAVVRGPESAAAQTDPLRWIVVPVTRQMEIDDAVIAEAVSEGRYRGWPMLAVGTHTSRRGNTQSEELDRLVSDWQRQFPNVHIYPISHHSDVAQFLRDSPEINGLVVLDAAHSPDVARIVGAGAHANRDLAVLVVREKATVAVGADSADLAAPVPSGVAARPWTDTPTPRATQ